MTTRKTRKRMMIEFSSPFHPLEWIGQENGYASRYSWCLLRWELRYDLTTIDRLG